MTPRATLHAHKSFDNNFALGAAIQITYRCPLAPIVEAVAIPMAPRQVNEAGNFTPSDAQVAAATTMLDELLRWSAALKPLRQPMN